MNDCTCNPPRAKLACRVCLKRLCGCQMRRWICSGPSGRGRFSHDWFCLDCGKKHQDTIQRIHDAECAAIEAAAYAREKALNELREAR